MPTTKHIPVRQCIACRQRRPKRELLRVVMVEGQDQRVEGQDQMGEAGPVIDPTGRRAGRGAYVCPDKKECWNEKKLRRFAGAKAPELSLALQTLLADRLNQKVVGQDQKVEGQDQMNGDLSEPATNNRNKPKGISNG